MKIHFDHNGKALCGTTNQREDPTFYRDHMRFSDKREEVTCKRCRDTLGKGYLNAGLDDDPRDR